MRSLCLLACLLSCATPSQESFIQPEPREVTTFSLSRNTLWSAPSANNKQFAMLDVEVVRVIDLAGDEVWGRRLSIGALRSVTYCDNSWIVLGERGAARLSQDGLLQPWGAPVTRPNFVTRSAAGSCVFDAPAIGAWRQGDTWLAADKKSQVSLTKDLLTGPSWKATISCEASCPITISGEFVAVAEERQVSFFSLADGTRIGAIAPGVAKIISLSATDDALLLSRDDGAVSLWQGTPHK